MSEWFYFIDTDERFDERYATIYRAAQTSENVISFYIIQLWDDEKLYRKDYPRTYETGLQIRTSMFRNLGSAQIYSSSKSFHFSLVPFKTDNFFRSPILIRHYGRLTAEMRKQKYKLYKKRDKNHDQAG